jgi:hypothetical protein
VKVPAARPGNCLDVGEYDIIVIADCPDDDTEVAAPLELGSAGKPPPQDAACLQRRRNGLVYEDLQ